MENTAITDFDAGSRLNGYYLEYFLTKYGGTIFIYRPDYQSMLQAKEEFNGRNELLRTLLVCDGKTTLVSVTNLSASASKKS